MVQENEKSQAAQPMNSALEKLKQPAMDAATATGVDNTSAQREVFAAPTTANLLTNEETQLRTQTLGQQLKAARVRQNISIEEIADKTLFSSRIIRALEEDDLTSLPKVPIYQKGLLRAYARAVKLDPVPLEFEFSALVQKATPSQQKLGAENPSEQKQLPSEKNTHAAMPAMEEQYKHNSWPAIMVGVLVVASIFAYGYLGNFVAADKAAEVVQNAGSEVAGSVQISPSELPLKTSADVLAKSDDAAHEGMKTGANNPAIEDLPKTSVAGKSTSDNAAAGVERNKPPTSAMKAEAVREASSAKLPFVKVAPAELNPLVEGETKSSATIGTPMPVGARTLVLEAREDTWVGVSDDQQRNLMSTLLVAGSKRILTIRGPVQLVVGNAAGLDVTFGQRVIDITRLAKQNVAHIELK